MNTQNSKTDFDNKVHKLGITTALIIWVFFISVPLGISLLFKIDVDYISTLSIAIPIAVTFGIIGLCEKLSMAPIIGSGAVYLASSTGNVQNMKLPAALNAMRLLNCEEGSEKGKVIAILAVASSAVVTTVIVFLGMLFLAPLLQPVLVNPVLQPAFDYMLPSLLGPLVFPVVLKNPKAASIPFSIAIIAAIALGSSYTSVQSIIMVVVILLSVGIIKTIMKRKK